MIRTFFPSIFQYLTELKNLRDLIHEEETSVIINDQMPQYSHLEMIKSHINQVLYSV